MALLDLQSMETSAAPSGGPPKGSRASKHCGGGGASALSLLLC
jgi:hypothetical protein